MASLLAAEAGILETELTVVVMLATAAVVAIVVRRVKVPFTVALVVVGLAFAFFPNFSDIDLDPEVILGILVPPLLFEATLQLPWPKLKADLGPILVTAIGGTLIGTFVVAGVVGPIVDIPWLAAVAFGALISATDPVAVIAFFKSLGVDKRLSVLVEGESLFNDGAAIVLFTLAIEAADEGTSLTVGAGLESFFVVGGGGLAVGLILGYVVSTIVLKNVDDHLIETAVTLALAYGSFLVAESFGAIFGIADFHLSGILAVVAAGLTVGHVGLVNTSPTTRLALDNFWEFLAFLVNSFVFLIIGIQINLTELSLSAKAIGVAILVTLAVRVFIIYGFTFVQGFVPKVAPVPVPFRHVMFWGGLRGAISLALALSVTTPTFSQEVVDTVRVMTFGVVLFTLLVQGMTITSLIDRLHLAGKPENVLEQQRRQATLFAQRAGRERLQLLGDKGVLFEDMSEAMAEVYTDEIEGTGRQLGGHFRAHPELEVSMLLQARRDGIAAERTAVIELSRRGLIGEEVVEELSVDLNNRLVALDLLEERWESEPDPLGVDPD